MKNFTRLMLAFALFIMGAGEAKSQEPIYSIDYSTYNSFPFYVMGFTPEWVDGIMTDRGAEGWHQYFIADGIPTEKDGSYVVKALVRSSATLQFNINMGWGWGEGEVLGASVTIPQSTEFQEVVWQYEGIGGTSCNLVAQPWSNPTIEWKSLQVFYSGQTVEPVWTNILNDEGFVAKVYPSTAPVVTAPVNGEYVVESPAKVSQDWDTQFWINLPYALPAGTKFKVSFNCKASSEQSVGTQAHNNPGEYVHWACLGDVKFPTEYAAEPIVITGAVPAECNGKQHDNGDGTFANYVNDFKSIAFNLTKSTAVTYYIKDIKFEIDEAVATEAGIEAAFQRMSAEIAEIQATYDLVYSEFVALAQINGSGWAASFGGKLGGIQSGINAMKGALGNLYIQGELTPESTLASIYEQYDTIVGDLNSLKAQFEQAINAQVQSILYDLNMVTSSQMGSLIGNLQSTLTEYGVAEQYADRVNALLAKKTDAAQKVSDCMAAIAATTSYVDRLAAAKNAKVEVYAILAEITAEVEAILAEAKELESVKTAINEAAFQRMSAEIAEIQATYDLVYSEFVALAQTNGSGWAASYGGKLGGIQSGINAMKGTLGSLYAQVALTEESTLASIYEQYDTIVGDLNSLKAQFEQAINAQVQSILYDLSMVTSSQMGSLIGNLQNELNNLGVAEKYADRVNALLTMKAEAAQKVEECMAAIAAATNYVDRLAAAKNAKTDVYAILAVITAEVEAILAEVNETVGISAVKYADSFAKGLVYDLNGRRVTVPAKGMFVINGKKVVIK